MAKKKKSSAYWKKRFSDLEAANNAYGQRTFHQIEPAFDKAQRQIQAQIESWYSRYAKNNGITMAEARKQLSAAELKELQWDVQEYIKYGQENAMNRQWMKELENASARFHISRLEALKLRTQQSLEVAFGNELDSLDGMVKRLYQSGYYHTCFEVQKGFNIGWEIGQIDERKLQKVISKPWAADGKTFSDRVWQSKTTMVNELHQQLTRTIIQGKAPDEAIRTLSKYVADKTKNAKYAAGRLVMTEQAFISSAAQKDAFNDLDVEEFEIVATLDSHTSEICQNMDGQHFPMKDFEPGVTAPPFHVWCRSTTVPYFDDEWGRSGERAARNADGKTYYVPSDMTYPEWQKSFVDGQTEDLKPVVPDDIMKTVTTVEEAKKALVDDVGFSMVEDSLLKINSEQIIQNTNQLLSLENKFGCIKKSGGMTICSAASKNACAFVSSSYTKAPRASNHLSLCPGTYKKTTDETIEALRQERLNKWSMPFADGNEVAYNVTHEYGHIIQNVLEQERMIEKGLKLDDPLKFVDKTKLMSSAKKTRLKAYKWYSDISKEVQDECFDEIIAIAKDNNPDFSLVDNISRYGKTDKCEFFAEVFANSQLGDPNELGKAMNIWLKKKGLIK